MPSVFNTLPSTVAIGMVQDSSGNMLPVMPTPEFLRAQASLLERLGGSVGLDVDDITNAFASTPTMDANVAALQNVVQVLLVRLASVTSENARLAALERKFGELTSLVHSLAPSRPVDWEHPGKIGAATRNSGSFTSLAIDAGLVGKPSLYFGADTTTGFYRIGANNIGLTIAGTKLVDYSAAKVSITGTLTSTGSATLGDGTTTVNVVSSGAGTGANAGATFVVQAGGSTVLGFGNRSALIGGAFSSVPYIYHVGTLTTYGSMAIGGDLTVSTKFGCNGKAAQAAAALGAAAIDPASTQTLANNIRAALIACGIGS